MGDGVRSESDACGGNSVVVVPLECCVREGVREGVDGSADEGVDDFAHASHEYDGVQSEIIEHESTLPFVSRATGPKHHI